MTGSLLVVGTGIQAAGHITIEARNAIVGAAKVFYLVGDPVAEQYVRSLNPYAESLAVHYREGRERYDTYLDMVEVVLVAVRTGADVCVAFYGHPGVFVFPSREMIRGVRRLGRPARMLPGVSAEDCLFADLGVDPGIPGCQSFEATSFLQNRWRFDRRCSLILWQVGVVGLTQYRSAGAGPEGLRALASVLADVYGPDHEAVLYEAANYPNFDHLAKTVRVGHLGDAQVRPAMTLYVPSVEAVGT